MWNEDDLPVIVSKGYFALVDIMDVAAKRFLYGGDIAPWITRGQEIIALLYAAQRSDLLTYEQYETILNCLIDKGNIR